MPTPESLPEVHPPVAVSSVEHNYGLGDAEMLRAKPAYVLYTRLGCAAMELLTAEQYRDEVIEILGQEAAGSAYFDLRSRAIEDARATLADRLGDEQGHPETAAGALARYSAQNLSDEGVVDFYKQRQANLAEKERQYEARFGELKGEFVEAITWAKSRGLKVDLDRVKTRVEQVAIGLFDNVLRDGEPNVGGFYYEQSDQILILPEIMQSDDTGYQKRVVFHELLHAMAGMRLAQNPITQIVDKQRGGLRGQVAKFTWLDEAITEQLALVLADQPRSAVLKREINFSARSSWGFFHRGGLLAQGGYQSERRAVASMLSYIDVTQPSRREKPLQPLLRAYFEDYEPDGHESVSGRQPARKKVFQVFNKYFPVAELERVYESQGADGLGETVDRQIKQNSRLWRAPTLQRRQDKQARARFQRRTDRKRTREVIAKHRDRSSEAE